MMICRALLVATLLVSTASDVVAGANEWTAAGPEGAFIADIQYVNGNGTALALSSRRIYRTTDHGAVPS